MIVDVPVRGRWRGTMLAGVRRFWPLFVLASCGAAAVALGAHRWISFAWLAQQQQVIQAFVQQHPAAAPLAFVALYALAVACAFPGGIVFSMSAGFLFGTVPGGCYAVVAITAGSVVLFLAARSALRPIFERLAPRAVLEGMSGGSNGFLLMLTVRLIPFTPFWLVNVAASLTGIRLRDYAWATLIGIAPITFVLASLGAGFGETVEAGRQPGLDALFSLPILLPLLSLAALSAAMLPIRRWIGRRRKPALASLSSTA